MATSTTTTFITLITFCIFLHLTTSLKHYPLNKGPNSLRPVNLPTSTHEREDDESPLKVVCYYGSWAVYRPGQGKFPVEEIDPFLCSHIIYGFAGLGSDGRIRALDPYNDLKDNWGKGAFQRFTGLKTVNPKLKSLIAIGGWNEGSVKYSNMASSGESRAVFVRSVVEFLDRYGFEGLDMDWEYPASRGGKPEDKRNFVLLLQELKEAFRPKGYLLTAAVSAGKYFADPAYDIPQVSKYLDIINVMTYDYHGGWETKTGHNAPLYARPDEYGNDRILNVNYSINYWISHGAPRSKIVLGLGSYGRSFTLSRANANGLGAPAPQKGQAGPYTREGGSLGYNEICEMQQRDPAAMTIVWDRHHLAPYAYWGRQWVGYDNVRSITLKAAYARAMGLGGAMLWSLETDDFANRCGGGRYPLLNAVKRVFAEEEVPPLPLPGAGEEESSSTTSTRRPSTSTTTTTTTTRRPTTTPTTTTTTTTTTERPTKTTPTTTTTTNSQRPSSTSTSTTYRPETEPTTTSTTTTTTTRRPPFSSTITTPSTTSTTTEDYPISSSTSTSTSTTTINWWPHQSSTWWPQKSSTWWPQNSSQQPTAGSEVWWSSTTPSSSSSSSTSSKEPADNPNSIPETEEDKKRKKNDDFICTESGLFRSPASCTAFIRCLETAVEGQFQLFFHQCPDRTVFNADSRLCDWVENVPECIKAVPRYYLRGTFQTNFQVVHGESGSGGGEREGAVSSV